MAVVGDFWDLKIKVHESARQVEKAHSSMMIDSKYERQYNDAVIALENMEEDLDNCYQQLLEENALTDDIKIAFAIYQGKTIIPFLNNEDELISFWRTTTSSLRFKQMQALGYANDYISAINYDAPFEALPIGVQKRMRGLII